MWNFNHLLGRASASEDDNDDNKEKSKKAKSRAEEDDKDKEDAEDDDQDDNKDDDKKDGKKAKSRADDSDDDDDDADAEEEDDDDDDKDKKKDAKKAERDRCAKIFASEYAAGRPALAASLAFNTSLSAKAAIAVLAGAGVEAPAGRKSLDERMQQVKSVKIGPDGSPEGKSASALVNKMASLYNQASGKK